MSILKKHVKRSKKQHVKPLQQRYCNILHKLDTDKFLKFAATRGWICQSRDTEKMVITKYDLVEEIYNHCDCKYWDISRHIYPLVAGFYFCSENYNDDWVRYDDSKDKTA